MISEQHVDDIQCGERESSHVKEREMKMPPFESIYSEVEERILGPWQRIRQRLLAPIAIILSRLGISADMLSFASVLFGIGFFLLAPSQFVIAFWLLVASVICYGLERPDSPCSGDHLCLYLHGPCYFPHVASSAGCLFLGHCSPQPHVALRSYRPLFFLSYRCAELFIARLLAGFSSSSNKLLEIKESPVDLS